MLVVQSDGFNRSRIQTVIAVVVTSNLRLVEAPGNVLLPKADSGLRRDSVANVSQVITLDLDVLSQRVAKLPRRLIAAVDEGLRLVLSL